jgi:isocitrate dehydrogenase
MMTDSTITYTQVDEAPALATHSWLPILRAYTKGTGINIETADISLAGRIIANFPDDLTDDQKIPDELTRLGELAKTPEANIIKLPNISASIPQLQATIKELKAQGYKLPDYPEEPQTDADKELQSRFATVLGSAVNPVLREGNSDRRSSASVKAYAMKHPPPMGEWASDSQSHVSFMNDNDFFGSEISATVPDSTDARIEFVSESGDTTILKKSIPLLAGEVIDASSMSAKALRDFYAEQIDDAKADDVL